MNNWFRYGIPEARPDINVSQSLEKTIIIRNKKEKNLGTDRFLNNLYAYPPTFSVSRVKESNSNLPAVTINDTAHSFWSSNKLAPEQGFPASNSLRPNLLSDSKTQHQMSSDIVLKSVYSGRDYFNGYLSSNFTADFFSNVSKPIRKMLETTPVYLVLNGQNEVVLGHEQKFGDPAVPNNKLYDICGAFADNGTLKRKKLGLVFFGYNDAKNFMDALLKLEPEESNVVGLGIHCVSLESAYELIRSHHPGIDFRLMADTSKVISLFSVVTDSRFIFQEEIYCPKSDVVSKYGNMDLSDLKRSPLQALTKGIPVYSVKLQESKRGLLKISLRSLLNKADSFISFFIGPRTLGQKIMKGQLPSVEDCPDNTNTYLFFEYKKALDFCKKNNRFVVPFDGSYLGSRFDREPIILVTSLENLVEQWENKLSDAKHLNRILIAEGEEKVTLLNNELKEKNKQKLNTVLRLRSGPGEISPRIEEGKSEEKASKVDKTLTKGEENDTLLTKELKEIKKHVDIALRLSAEKKFEKEANKIEKTLAEAEKNATLDKALDKELKEKIEVKNQSDALIDQTKKRLEEMDKTEELISENEVEEIMFKVDQALKIEDVEIIKKLKEEINEKNEEINEKVYSQAINTNTLSKYDFVGVHDSEKPWNTEEIKLLNSPIRKMARGIKVRSRILNCWLQILWRI